MEYPRIVVDERGYLRVEVAENIMLPETELLIKNIANAGEETKCEVTVTFIAKHHLKTKD